MPRLTLSASFTVLGSLREFVGRLARQANFSEKEVYFLQLAADEAASNIIEHAYQDISSAEFEVTCDLTPSALIILMRDHGAPFDPSKVRQPNLKAHLSSRQIGGLGLYLINRIMDEVSYQSDPATGNLLTMVKYRS